jgi:hypothetical protein
MAVTTDAFDRDIRLTIYRGFVDDQRPPTAPELAAELGVATEDVEGNWGAHTKGRRHVCTIHQARQLVSHGHVLIDGRRIDVPSAQVKAGQEISLTDKARDFIAVREAIQITPDPPGYLYRNTDEIKGAFIRVPERDEIPLPVTLEERLVVEFYS